MARKKRELGLPPGGRWTNAAKTNIATTFTVERDGKPARLSHSKVKPDEPKTYGSEAEAWEGYHRVTAYLEQRVEAGVTLGEFWEDWTNSEHWRWGKLKKRGRSSLVRYRSSTRAFVERYHKGIRNYDAPLESITTAHIEAHMQAGGSRSCLVVLGTLFNDAIEAGVRTTHPCRKLSTDAAKAAEADREKRRRKPPVEDQIAAMLRRAREGQYPRSLWGWLNVGTETGARGGEIDVMGWDFYDPATGRYWIDEQWNMSVREFTDPKHGSKRWLQFDDPLMEIVESFRGEHPRFFFTNPRYNQHWRQDTRDYWWTWTRDGGPSLHALCEGRTMKEATRHFYAWRAINIWNYAPHKLAPVYGHKDGGKTLLKHYTEIDHELALSDLLAAKRAAVVDLSAVRRRKSA